MDSNEFEKYGVLFVDDEIQVLKAVKRGIHLEKYKKYFASSGEQALEMIEKENISLIVTDMKMPKMDGLQLLKKVNEIKPDIIKIILSGYTNTAQIIATINHINIYKFILKPWDLDTELKPLILEGLKKYDDDIKNKLDIVSATQKNALFKKLVNENKQTFLQIEHDFESVLKFHKMEINYSYLLAMQLRKENIDGIRIKQELNYIDSIISDFIKRLPTKNKLFNINKFHKVIDKRLKDDYYHEFKDIYPKFIINTSISKTDDFEINYDTFLKLTDIILTDFFKMNYDSRIDLIIKENDKNMVFIYTVDNNESLLDDIRKNTIYILLNTFSDILKGKLKIIKNEKNNNVVVLEIFNYFK